MRIIILYVKSSFNELFRHHPLKWLIVAAYLGIAALCLYAVSNSLDSTDGNQLLALLFQAAEILVATILIIGMVFVLAAIGKPLVSYPIHRRLCEIGITNHHWQHPVLVSCRKDKNKKNGRIYKFANMGISIDEFVRKQSAIGQALKSRVLLFELAKNPAYTLAHVIPLKHDKPTEILSTSEFLVHGLINLLCVGNTGSGKSVAMSVILAALIRFNPDISVTICDYKKSSFAQFEDTPNFYGYEDVPDGIRKFYKEFQERLEANDEHKNSQRRVLLIDEYGALIAAQDKKVADELKMMIANMLFMSRSLGLIVIVGVQRADAEHFKAGARDQFRAILALGNLSPQQKQMIAPDIKDSMTANNPVGYGYLIVDGQEIDRVKVIPGDLDESDRIIRSNMYH